MAKVPRVLCRTRYRIAPKHKRVKMSHISRKDPAAILRLTWHIFSSEIRLHVWRVQALIFTISRESGERLTKTVHVPARRKHFPSPTL